jgi:hypothetical protein
MTKNGYFCCILCDPSIYVILAEEALALRVCGDLSKTGLDARKSLVLLGSLGIPRSNMHSIIQKHSASLLFQNDSNQWYPIDKRVSLGFREMITATCSNHLLKKANRILTKNADVNCPYSSRLFENDYEQQCAL